MIFTRGGGGGGGGRETRLHASLLKVIPIIYMYLTLKNDKLICMYSVLQYKSLFVYLNILYTTLEIKRNSLVSVWVSELNI